MQNPELTLNYTQHNYNNNNTSTEPQEKKVKKKYPKKIWIEKEDFDTLNKLLDEMYSHNYVKWFNLKLLYSILYWSGLRISEALDLSKKQLVDYINGHSIQVVISKTYSSRQLLNTKHIYEQFGFFRQHIDDISELGFVNSFGRKLTFRQAQKWSFPLMYRLQELKFGKVDDPSKLLITLHSFRCSFINRLIRSKVPLPDVSQIVHHKSINTTMGYLRAYPDMNRFNDMLDNVDF